jgi:non-specific serine/threonine protein kinase
MGAVYHARDVRLGRDVAVKVLPSELQADPERLRRFEREARAASALNHPNVLTVHDVGTEDGVSFITTELVLGRTLRDRIASGPLPPGELLDLAAQVAAGLAKAHEAGIVHRDLKPENVMVTEDGLVKILDFGLAKLREQEASGDVSAVATRTGTVLGTVGYMAPEQARGQEVDFRADQFALGAVLYEMATGQRAFHRSTAAATLSALLHDQPPPIRSRNAAVPRELQWIVERCLAKDPGARYAETREVARELTALRSGAALGPPPRQARRAQLAAAAALLLLLAAGAVLLLVPRGHQPPAARFSSIAVLPFQTLGPHTEDEYFADGMSEAIMTELTKVPGLLVISRNSVVGYKGRGVDPRQVGRDLHVSYVLDGSLQRADRSLRVSARLADAATGYQLWAEHYDGAIDDVFRLQDEISARVAGALRLSVAPSGRPRAAPPTGNLEAYDAYLRGRFQLHRVTIPERLEAIPFLERAIALDPGFALAHAALADAYSYKFFYADPEKEWERRAYAEIEKALAVDPNLAEAYLAKGNLLWTLPNGFPHEAAVEEYRRALRLNPNLLEAHTALGRLYQHVGLLDEALEELQTAQREDPGDNEVAGRIATTYFFRHNYEQALKHFERASLSRFGWGKAMVLSYLGHDTEALEVIDGVLRREPEDLRTLSARALLLARAGQRREARKEIERVAGAARNERGYSSYHHAQYNVAATYAVMGDKPRAVEWLRKAAAEGFPCYPFYASDPNLSGLERDPAFDSFMARLKEDWERRRAALRL